jgi:hypothetical protein
MLTLSEYFSPDYFSARARFREKVVNAGGDLSALEIDARGPAGEVLTIDIAWFGSKTPRRVLLHSSGLHGVEGFAGSAIQLRILDALPEIPDDGALIFLHVLNPYGMAWLRRVNENNVDLNRNFVADGLAIDPVPLYQKLNSLLNPTRKQPSALFWAKAAYLIPRYGLSTLRQASAGGQRRFPKGVFFGGARMEQGPATIQNWLADHLACAGRITAIDIHTGLGPYGEDSLLVGRRDFEEMRNLFGERVKSFDPNQGPAFRVEGSLDSILGDAFGERVRYLAQEFGTYDSVRVLRRLIKENCAHHYEGGKPLSEEKLALREAFCPDDTAWRFRVIQRGEELFRSACVSALG